MKNIAKILICLVLTLSVISMVEQSYAFTSSLQKVESTKKQFSADPIEQEKNEMEESRQKQAIRLLQPAISKDDKKIGSLREKIIQKFKAEPKNIQALKLNDISGTPHRLISNLFVLEGKELDKVLTFKEEEINAVVKRFLEKHKDIFGADVSQLKLYSVRKIKDSIAVTYQQYVNGIPVKNALTTVIIGTKQGRIPSVGIDFYTINTPLQAKISKSVTLETAQKDIGFDNKRDEIAEDASLVILPVNKDVFILAYTFVLQTKGKDNFGEWRYYVDANKNKVILKYNNIKSERPTKAIINQKIPAEVSGKIEAEILPAYYNDSPMLNPFANEKINLNNLSIETDQNGKYNFGSYKGGAYNLSTALEGSFAKVCNDEVGYEDGAENISYQRSIIIPSLLFGSLENIVMFKSESKELVYSYIINWTKKYNINYDSNEAASASDLGGFMDQLNAFYHVNKVYDYVKNTLGYYPTEEDPAMDWQMPVYIRSQLVDYYYGGDNAFYSPEDKEIHMGGGGEHLRNLSLFADIFYHEYTHAVDHAIYGENELPYIDGTESGAMEEGFADYFACSLTNEPLEGEGGVYWESSPYWEEYFRNLDNTNRYPDDWQGEVHDDSEIFSGALWDLRKAFGTETADYLIHNARFGYPQNFADFEYEVLVLDDVVNGDADISNLTPNFYEIFLSFFKHGIGAYYEYGIDDDSLGESQGNSNGIPEAGEIVELKIMIDYGLNIPLSGVYADLFTADPYINIQNNRIEFPVFEKGENSAVFVINIANGTPKYYSINFNLNITVEPYESLFYTTEINITTDVKIINLEGLNSNSYQGYVFHEDKIIYENDSFGSYVYNINSQKNNVIGYNDEDFPDLSDIWGNVVVWTYYYNQTSDIGVYDLAANKKTLLEISGFQRYPAIYDSTIVWQEEKDGSKNLYMYDISLKTQTLIPTNGSEPSSPDIYGDKIVYTAYSGHSYDIYIYDIMSGQVNQIISDAVDDYGPVIYEDKIVWYGIEHDTYKYAIYMYNISTSETTQLTFDGAEKINVDINQDKIVWQDKRNGNWDIYIYELESLQELQLTSSSFDEVQPGVYNDKIVWHDCSPGATRLAIFSILSLPEAFSVRITSVSGNEEHPVIYGNRIVYYNARNGNYDIYVYDLTTRQETQITNNTATQQNPDVYGNRVVWEDWRSGGDNADIYMYDLETKQEIQITSNTRSQVEPKIYGDRIVWKDYRNNTDIYLYDLTTHQEKRITVNYSSAGSPAIYDNKIVWSDRRRDGGDIYMYDLNTSTEIPISVNSNQQTTPSIYGDKIVWLDYRNGNSNPDIYMYNLTTGQEKQITTNTGYQWQPDIFADKVVWTDQRNGNEDIYMFDLATEEEYRITYAGENDDYPGNEKQSNASIYENKIVWEDYRYFYADIFMLEF